MPESIPDLFRTAMDAKDPPEFRRAASGLFQAIGRIPPRTPDSVREELMRVMAMPKQSKLMDALSQLKTIIAAMAREVLSSQVHSRDYGAPESVLQKQLHEDVLGHLYEAYLVYDTPTDDPRHRDMDGLTEGELAAAMRLSPEQLHAVLAPIFFPRSNGKDQDDQPETSFATQFVTSEQVDKVDYFVLTGEGFDEAKRLHGEKQIQPSVPVGETPQGEGNHS